MKAKNIFPVDVENISTTNLPQPLSNIVEEIKERKRKSCASGYDKQSYDKHSYDKHDRYDRYVDEPRYEHYKATSSK